MGGGAADHTIKKTDRIAMPRQQSTVVSTSTTNTKTKRHLEGFDTRHDSYSDLDLAPIFRHDKGADGGLPVAAQEKDAKDQEEEVDVETLIHETDKGKGKDDDELVDKLATNLSNQMESGNQTEGIKKNNNEIVIRAP